MKKKVLLPIVILVAVSYTHLDVYKRQVRGAGIGRLSAFVELIEVITSLADDLSPIPYLQKVIELTGLKAMYNDGSVEGQSRMDNIAELVSALDDFITRKKLEQDEEEPSLEDFVREMTLYTDQDTEDDLSLIHI